MPTFAVLSSDSMILNCYNINLGRLPVRVGGFFVYDIFSRTAW